MGMPVAKQRLSGQEQKIPNGVIKAKKRQKYDVDADPENPEVDDPELRVKDPVIEPGIDGNHRAHREHIMKVGNDKVGVVKAHAEARRGLGSSPIPQHFVS